MKEPTPCPEAVIDGVRSLVRDTVQCPDCIGGGRWCETCDGDGRVYDLKACTRKFERFLRDLRWAGDHYCIPNWCGMYVGIETDGYVHT
jgi:hypothetical protein